MRLGGPLSLRESGDARTDRRRRGFEQLFVIDQQPLVKDFEVGGTRHEWAVVAIVTTLTLVHVRAAAEHYPSLGFKIVQFKANEAGAQVFARDGVRIGRHWESRGYLVSCSTDRHSPSWGGADLSCHWAMCGG